MRVVAAVPVQALAGAKSRLAPALAPDERAALTLRLLGGVLDALAAPDVAARLVVSPDPAVLAAARAAGQGDAAALLQTAVRRDGPDGLDGLNAALVAAREWAEGRGADALLVVLGDLPLLSRADVAAILALARHTPAAVVLAPDRHEHGTNALLLRPPGAIPFAFGPGSLARHLEAAAARDLPAHLYRSPGTALDVDTPDDLAAVADRFADLPSLGALARGRG
jgi:2-phospho-L-lactate/phosphoenolpyruvate guanylyltransferase